MEDNLNLLENGRRPQIFGIWNNLNMFANGREPQYKDNWRTISVPLKGNFYLVTASIAS
jgi:hypothetical protein